MNFLAKVFLTPIVQFFFLKFYLFLDLVLQYSSFYAWSPLRLIIKCSFDSGNFMNFIHLKTCIQKSRLTMKQEFAVNDVFAAEGFYYWCEYQRNFAERS